MAGGKGVVAGGDAADERVVQEKVADVPGAQLGGGEHAEVEALHEFGDGGGRQGGETGAEEFGGGGSAETGFARAGEEEGREGFGEAQEKRPKSGWSWKRGAPPYFEYDFRWWRSIR